MYKKLASVLLFAMFTSPAMAQPIVTDSTSRSTTETTLNSLPPTAVAPAVTTINNDVCAVAASGDGRWTIQIMILT